MRFKSVGQVVEAFEKASHAAGHRRNTRNSYLSTVRDYATLLKAGKIDGPQAYFDYLSSEYNRKFEETYRRIGSELGGDGINYENSVAGLDEYTAAKEADREAELRRLDAESLLEQGSKRKRRRRKPTPGAFGGRRRR